MSLSKSSIVIIFTFLFSNAVFAQVETENMQTSEAYQIGLMIQELQQALSVRDEKSTETIRLYGTDSRYYSMIRGWLFQELVGVESQLHANKGKKSAEKFQIHSDFLKSAIRAIDLE